MFWLLFPATAAQVSIHVSAGWREEWCKLSTQHLLKRLRRESYNLKMVSWLLSGPASFCHSTQTKQILSPSFTYCCLCNNWHFSDIFPVIFQVSFLILYFILKAEREINLQTRHGQVLIKVVWQVGSWHPLPKQETSLFSWPVQYQILGILKNITAV